jgi:hypothetical protein
MDMILEAAIMGWARIHSKNCVEMIYEVCLDPLTSALDRALFVI